MHNHQWFREAKERYISDSSRNTSLPTDMSRGEDAIWGLNQLVKGDFSSKEKLNVLLIGAGYHARSGKKSVQVLCPYELFNVAAYFDWKNLDYSITVVDIDPVALSDVTNRENIFVPHAFVKDHPDEYSPRMNWRKNAWKRYLTMTKQSDKLTHQKMEGLATNPPEALDDLLEEGVHYAAIPRSFTQKISNGDVEAINGDIAIVELNKKFDYIICSNVLYMLPKEGQQLAINNMVSSLAEQGAMFLWEPLKTRKKEEGISPIIQRNAGWLTDKIKQDMRIRESNMNDFDRKSQQVMLTRY